MIRERRPEDLPEAAAALVAVHARNGYPVEGVADPAAWLRPPGLVRAWVAELGGKVVGHVALTEPATLGRLFVHPDARGHSVGERLVRTVMAHAAARAQRLVLEVVAKDVAAIRLYERLGWRRTGTTTHHFGDGRSIPAYLFEAPALVVRPALPGELSAVGDLRVEAYAAQHLLDANPAYADTLRGLNGGEVFVAVEDGELLGTVMLEHWGPNSEVARGAEEAEVRALAVAPAAQGRGVGAALLRAVVDRAEALGLRHLVLSTQPAMTSAQRLYTAHGFTRLPERDWAPIPELTLLSFGRRLTRPGGLPRGDQDHVV